MTASQPAQPEFSNGVITPIQAIAVARPRSTKKGYGAFHTYPGHGFSSHSDQAASSFHLPHMAPWPLRQQGQKRRELLQTKASRWFKHSLLAVFCCYSLTSLILNAASIIRLAEKIEPVHAIQAATQAKSDELDASLKRTRQPSGREALLRNTLDYTEAGDLLIRFRSV
ncbi:MAG: hypothetical protein VKK59_07175 [Vampirovibrionales bacterium]|nr:hypothetical protein [Vampirovibrionales bacterium]